MVAVRWRNSDVQQPPSLYASTTAGVKLNRKHPGSSTDGVRTPEEMTSQIGSARELSHEKNEHGLHLIIASEPSSEFFSIAYPNRGYDTIGRRSGWSTF